MQKRNVYFGLFFLFFILLTTHHTEAYIGGPWTGWSVGTATFGDGSSNFYVEAGVYPTYTQGESIYPGMQAYYDCGGTWCGTLSVSSRHYIDGVEVTTWGAPAPLTLGQHTYRFWLLTSGLNGLNSNISVPFTVVPFTGFAVTYPNISSAGWTITGPVTRSGVGSVSSSLLPSGSYTITWGDVAGYTKPATETLTLVAPTTIYFYGTYVIAQPVYSLSVLKAGTGTGTVTSSPAGISCGSTCTHNFSGSVVLTASPTSGTFSGWSGAGCSGTGTCTVSMTSAKSVTATFTAPITTVNGSCSTTAETCTAGTYSNSPADNATNKQWTCLGAGTPVGTNSPTCTSPQPIPVTTFTGTPTTLPAGGGNVAFTWSITNPAGGGSCTAYGGNFAGAKATSGTQTVNVPTTTTFDLDCWNGNGTAAARKSVTITVSATTTVNGSCSTTAETCTAGTYSNSPADNATNKQWTCLGAGTPVGTNSPTCTSPQPIPVTTFTGTPTTLPAGGGNVAFTWSITNPAGGGSCTAYGGNFAGAKATSGTQTVNVPTTTTFDLDCWNGNGTAAARKSVTITVSATPSFACFGSLTNSVRWNLTLPITESTPYSYSSTDPGPSVACKYRCDSYSYWNSTYSRCDRYTCGGSRPVGTTVHPDDASNLTTPKNYGYSAANTGSKCEYYCTDPTDTWNATMKTCDSTVVCGACGDTNTHCSGTTYPNPSGPSCPLCSGTRYCNFNWTETAPGS